MTPSELTTFLEITLATRLPILIKGAPGIGKTDIVKQACSRAVHSVARLIQAHLPRELQLEAFTGAAGEAFALELMGFLHVFKILPDIDRVLADPAGTGCPEDPATLYAMCGALAGRADKITMPSIVEYAKRLPPELSVLLITDSSAHNPEVTETRAFIEWSSVNNSVLV